jgi:hypothetical protein
LQQNIIGNISKEDCTKILEQNQARTHWDTEKEFGYISVIDVIEILTRADRPCEYWNDLKAKLRKEGRK